MNIPNKQSLERAIAVLDGWLEFAYCPLHQDADSDEECTCGDEAQVLIVRDYLQELTGEK